MIGIDQEPNRETLAALNGALGEGNYQVQYEQTEHGVRAIVRTHEKPPRTWNTRFAAGLAREQVDAVWQEFASRISKSNGKVEPLDPTPPETALRAIKEALGERVEFSITYERRAADIVAQVRTNEDPPRAFSVGFQHEHTREQIDELWNRAASNLSPETAHARVVGGTGTGEGASSGSGGGSFESSTADEGGAVASDVDDEAEGSRTDPNRR
jgi:hypothetical protein